MAKTANNIAKKYLKYLQIIKKTQQFQNPPNPTSKSFLQEQLKRLKAQTAKKQQECMLKQRSYRIQLLKNQKMKDDVCEIDKLFNITKRKMAIEMYQKNKNNKQSPMFYNQHGLCPFQLMLLKQIKYQQEAEGLICMICFQDIYSNQALIDLPCEHSFHKDCGIQHLLGSKFCPSCSDFINVVDSPKEKMQKYK